MSRIADLLDKAKADTGLEHFGEDTFREGLEIVVDSAEREGRMNENGRTGFYGIVNLLLTTRLQIEDWYRRHPEIDDEAVEQPLIVLGLPRTGSTATFCLLGEDPNVRFLRQWEGLFPVPPPEAATQFTDPRIAEMQKAMDYRNRVKPRMKQMVPSSATSPAEDQMPMAYDFKSQIFQASWRVPAYVEWLNYKADLEPTFRYLKRVMKFLQWRCPPNRWRLKNPSHSAFIDALDKVFPDARYAMTHRDVADVIPSVADLYFELHHINTDEPDKVWMGEIMTECCELGMRRMIEFRDRGNEDRFFDIHFAPFQKDPFPTMERLYAWLGEEYTSEARERMEMWRRNEPRGKHGSHDYDPADFGLDKRELRERFRFYSDRFDVPLGSD
ncbi:MAG TPA: sulfotransferase [Novosphingobium sp.]